MTGCIILHVQPCPYAKVSLFQLGLSKVVKLICKVCGIHVGNNLQKICLSMVTLCLQNLQKGGNVGIDPCCISVDTAHRWEQAFSKYGQRLVPLNENLVDKIWESRPPHIVAPVCISGGVLWWITWNIVLVSWSLWEAAIFTTQFPSRNDSFLQRIKWLRGWLVHVKWEKALEVETMWVLFMWNVNVPSKGAHCDCLLPTQ